MSSGLRQRLFRTAPVPALTVNPGRPVASLDKDSVGLTCPRSSQWVADALTGLEITPRYTPCTLSRAWYFVKVFCTLFSMSWTNHVKRIANYESNVTEQPYLYHDLVATAEQRERFLSVCRMAVYEDLVTLNVSGNE